MSTPPPHHPAPPPDRWAAALTLAGLLLGLFSFRWAMRHPDAPWDGPLLLAAAAALLIAARRRGEGPRPTPASAPPIGAWGWPTLAGVPRWRIALGGASMGLTLLMLSRLLETDRATYDVEVALWLAATVAFVVAVAPPVSRPREDWGLWWEVHWPVVLAVGAIGVVAAGLRLWQVGSIPLAVGGDEGTQGLEALKVITGEYRNPFVTGWMGMPTISFYFNSLGIRLLGQSVAGLRAPWALLGILTVLNTFWLITRLRGLTLGLMTAALLATYHYHIHFSRLGANNIADPFFVTLALLFLYRARDRGSPLDWAMAGVTAGVAQFFYPGARFTIVLLVACLAFLAWESRTRRETLRDLLGGGLTLLGAFTIAAAPMLQYALRFPNEYNTRLNQVGIVQSGWLAREPALRGVSTWEVLQDQMMRAALAFNVFPDRTAWYGSPRPLMDGLWAALFGLGLLYATGRLLFPGADRRLFPLVLWWWAAMVAGGVLTESPPSVARLIVLAPVGCFFVALALLRAFQFLQESLGRRDSRELALLAAVAVLWLSMTSVRWYFAEFSPQALYGSRNGLIATEMADFLRESLEPDERVVLLGPPFLYLEFGTMPYLEPRVLDGINVLEPLAAPPTDQSLGLPPGTRPLFIALTLREAELQLVEQGFPGGSRYRVDDGKGEPLFWVYEP